MVKIFRNTILITIAVLGLIVFASCGGENNTNSGAPEIDGLTFVNEMNLDYAECFSVYNYEDGYTVIDVKDDVQYLVVPEDGDTPDNLPDEMVVIPKSPENIYMAATSVMAMYDSMDALDSVRLTELKEKDWTVENAAKAMSDGDILYAGKYSEPDYELILGEGCQLAIESTMIYHNPEVKEMIEKLGIPVFVDHSSYESDPLGRAEWIKVYGVISDRNGEAEDFFNSQKEIVNSIDKSKNSGKTVAFFYVSTSGKVVVRSPDDYIPAMIRSCGGTYVFDDLTEDTGKTSISMTMESFYEQAAEADYLVYNGNIDNTVNSIDDLKAKSDIFSNFKAIKSGNCYLSGSLMYQRTDKIGDMIVDFYRMLSGEDEEKMEFLTKME